MKNPKFYFEDYSRIFTDQDAGLAEHLNKVLSIHGFLQQRNKGDCLKVLKLVEMMDPNRSTLRFRDSVYPCAPLCLDDVLAAVKALEWGECPLGSILAVGTAIKKENLNNFTHPIREVSTIGSADQENPTRSIPSTIADSSVDAATAAASLEKSKRRGKRKLNPSRPISVHPPKTKSVKNFIYPVPSIGTTGHTEADNLSPRILAAMAGRKKSFCQQERRNRKLLAEVERSLNAK